MVKSVFPVGARVGEEAAYVTQGGSRRWSGGIPGLQAFPLWHG